jgi:hypothetical protein
VKVKKSHGKFATVHKTANAMLALVKTGGFVGKVAIAASDAGGALA